MQSRTRSVIRTVVALLAATVLTGASGCPTSSTEPKQNPLDCAKGFYQVGSACQPLPNLVTIAINSAKYNSTFSGFCPTPAPNPTSLAVNQDFRFQNNTSQNVTIIGWGGTPWVTVAPGQYSNALSFSSAGQVLYMISGCSGGQFVNDQYYGHITVTIA